MKAALVIGLALSPVGQGAAAGAPDLTESLPAQQAALSTGKVSAQDLTRQYLRAIGKLDRSGPSLHAVIAINPSALREARGLDRAQAMGRLRGPLHGVAVLIKDNIETAGEMPTTAGSLALRTNVTRRDAPLVSRLRAAGAVILGKTNLSEWANMRSSRSISGWSGVGGLVKNPYALDRTACGSSSGSAAAVAAGLAAAAIGTETDGSITCPAAMNGVVGLKPTVGLVSRTHVVPLSSTQDTPGPITRTVAGAAILLGAMAGSDPADPATREADARRADYVGALQTATLQGKRLGVLKSLTGYDEATDAVFASAVAALKAHGADVLELDYVPPPQIEADEHRILVTELKATLNTYLASLPGPLPARTLAQLIAFDKATPRETVLFGDELFEEAEATGGTDDPAYIEAKREAHRLAGPEGIDKLLADHKLDALIAPTTGPAGRIDTVAGDHFSASASTLPAVAGYPHLTVPMGQVKGLPVGLSFIGAAWSEATLLQIGYAFERATHARFAPTFARSIETAPGVAAALRPSRSR